LLDLGIELGPWTWLPLAASLLRLRRPRAPERLPWLMLGAFFAYVAWTGGDVLHLRFYVHVLPLVVALWSAGLATMLAPFAADERRVVRGAPPSPRRLPLAARAALAVLPAALACALGAVRFARATSTRAQFGPGYVVNNARNVQQVGLPLGEWLRTHAHPSMRIATWDIGGIGWASQLPILDLYGLTDPVIAHLIHDRAPLERRIDYVLQAQPELLVTYARKDGPEWSWLAPAADTIMTRYHYHSLWQAQTSGYWLVLLARNDVELPRIAAADATTAKPQH
jgi:hypothetical protein